MTYFLTRALSVAATTLLFATIAAPDAEARRAAPPEHNSAEGRGCSAFKPCPSGYKCIPFKQKCTLKNKPKPVYKPAPQPYKPAPQPYKPPVQSSGGAVGAKCYAGKPCMSGLVCSAATHRCVAFSGPGGQCATAPCASGLQCVGGVCRKPGAVAQPQPQPPKPQPPQQAQPPLVSFQGAGPHCANEGGRCNFQGKGRVTYGAGGRFTARVFDNGADCNNATFGDPIPGKVKRCYVKILAPAPAPGKPVVVVQQNNKPHPMVKNAVVLYEHGNFKGRQQVLGVGQYDIGVLQAGIGNDTLSSLRVTPGFEVTLFEHANFRGKRMVIRSTMGFVGGAFNDKASSILVRRL